MAAYQLLDGGASVLRTADKQVIPFDELNADYQDYLVWLAVPNVPDSIPTEALADARTRTKEEVDSEAENELSGWLGGGKAAALVGQIEASMLEEARRIVDDGSPTDAEFPLLKGMVDEGLASDLADAGTKVRADFDVNANKIGAVRAVRRKAHEDIDAAGTPAACDAVVAGLSWPT